MRCEFRIEFQGNEPCNEAWGLLMQTEAETEGSHPASVVVTAIFVGNFPDRIEAEIKRVRENLPQPSPVELSPSEDDPYSFHPGRILGCNPVVHK